MDDGDEKGRVRHIPFSFHCPLLTQKHFLFFDTHDLGVSHSVLWPPREFLNLHLDAAGESSIQNTISVERVAWHDFELPDEDWCRDGRANAQLRIQLSGNASPHGRVVTFYYCHPGFRINNMLMIQLPNMSSRVSCRCDAFGGPPLALASQSFSIVIALMPYIRETFRRHLSRSRRSF